MEPRLDVYVSLLLYCATQSLHVTDCVRPYLYGRARMLMNIPLCYNLNP